jgi:hypothetical protein
MTFNIQEYNIMVIRDKIAAVAMEEMDAKLGHKLSRKMVMDAFGMGLLAHAQGIPLDCVPVEMRDGYQAYDGLMQKMTVQLGDESLIKWLNEGAPMAGTRWTGDYRNVQEAEMREDWVGR